MDTSDGGNRNGNGHADPTPASLKSDTAAPSGAPVSGAAAPQAGIPDDTRDPLTGRIRKGKSLNPKGRTPGTPNLNDELIKAIKKFKLGQKGFLELFLTRALQDVEYAKLLAPKVFGNVDPPAGQAGVTIHNNQSSYENFISELRAERAALTRPGMEDGE